VSDQPVKVRLCGPADWDTVLHVDQLAFLYTWEGDPHADVETAVFEIDRTLLATVDDEPVGIAGAFSLDMSVPGTTLPVAGVTWVGVIPTARRRGVLTELMRAQLDEIRDRGEHVAALWASEPGIYGRFGYGPASSALSLRVDRREGAVDGPPGEQLRTRIVSVADARPAVEAVYEAVRAVRAGMPARDERWWARCMSDPPAARAGASELRALVVDEPGSGQQLAYALFSATQDWATGSAAGVVRVRETLASDGAGAAQLWRTLLNLDLVGAVDVTRLPVDDAFLHLVRDPRRAQPVLKDGLFVRLVDLPAALAARQYDVAWAGVVEVEDALAPWNAGRWRLVLGPDDVAVERTDDEPDLVCDVRELGGGYLGGASLVARARAGRVTERTPGAVAGLGRALRREPAPFCPFVF
jgi:predicted acetyltransferase